MQEDITFYKLAHDVNSQYAATLGETMATYWPGSSLGVDTCNANEYGHLLKNTQFTTVTVNPSDIPTWIVIKLAVAVTKRETAIRSARLRDQSTR